MPVGGPDEEDATRLEDAVALGKAGRDGIYVFENVLQKHEGLRTVLQRHPLGRARHHLRDTAEVARRLPHALLHRLHTDHGEARLRQFPHGGRLRPAADHGSGAAEAAGVHELVDAVEQIRGGAQAARVRPGIEQVLRSDQRADG